MRCPGRSDPFAAPARSRDLVQPRSNARARPRSRSAGRRSRLRLTHLLDVAPPRRNATVAQLRRPLDRKVERPASIPLTARPGRSRQSRTTNWLPWIFAKTTASGLVALLVAFTFNLDQPYWALLTVFIVSQPQQSGQVLAKSFYRIIGTVIGAAVALILVALCAQERVLFFGGLALWVGFCTFGSQYARNWAAYSFVLSGYTVAIVGIPGALDAGNAFYTATGRVSEISLGIIVAATVSHVVLPNSLVPSLWLAVSCG